MSTSLNLAPNDWFEHPGLLPPRPLALTETKYVRRFAVDLQAHRRSTDYNPLQLQYIPPNLDHLKAEELVSAVPDEDGQEDAEAGGLARASGGPGEEAQKVHDSSGPKTTEEGRTPAGDEAEGDDGLEGASQARVGPGGEICGAAGVHGERPPLPECEPFPLSQCARVNYETGAARNHIGIKTSGKKRGRGVQQLRGFAVLAQVERQGGEGGFPIFAVVKGKLLEINERLTKNPDLLYDRPSREGYVAILSPTPEAIKFFETRLVSEQEYMQLRGLTAEDLL